LKFNLESLSHLTTLADLPFSTSCPPKATNTTATTAAAASAETAAANAVLTAAAAAAAAVAAAAEAMASAAPLQSDTRSLSVCRRLRCRRRHPSLLALKEPFEISIGNKSRKWFPNVVIIPFLH